LRFGGDTELRGSDGAALQRDDAKPLDGEVVAFLGGSSTRPAAPALVPLFKRRWEFLLGAAQHPKALASAWRWMTDALFGVLCTHAGARIGGVQVLLAVVRGIWSRGKGDGACVKGDLLLHVCSLEKGA
jgi:hypothetical protein